MGADTFGGDPAETTTVSGLTATSLAMPPTSKNDLRAELVGQDPQDTAVYKILKSLESSIIADSERRFGQATSVRSFYLQPDNLDGLPRDRVLEQVRAIGFLPYGEAAKALAAEFNAQIKLGNDGINTLIDIFGGEPLAGAFLAQSLNDGLIAPQHAALVKEILTGNTAGLEPRSVQDLFSAWSKNLTLIASGYIPVELNEHRNDLHYQIVNGRNRPASKAASAIEVIVATTPRQAPLSNPTKVSFQPSTKTNIEFQTNQASVQPSRKKCTEKDILDEIQAAINEKREKEKSQNKEDPDTGSVYFISDEERAAIEEVIKRYLPMTSMAEITAITGPIDFTLGSAELTSLAHKIYNLRAQLTT